MDEVTHNGHVPTTTKQTMELVMERLETVIAARGSRNPSFVAEVAVFRIRYEKVHQALRIRISRRGKLKAHVVILTCCVGILRRWVSHGACPDIKLPLSVV